jgi:predicted Holliday junction resolvase-like endonuclease
LKQIMIIILGILFFAIVTACLYLIGLRKKITENQRLSEMLLNNGALRVQKYLKTHGYVREEEIGLLVQNVQAHEFGSRNTAIIASGEDFREQLIPYMLDRHFLLKTEGVDGETLYYLPEQ